MPKQGLITALCLLLLLLLSCRNESGVTIRGEISNLESPYIPITHISAEVLVIDTITVNNRRGRFVFRADIDAPTAFTLYLNENENAVVVFADRGERLSVRGDAQMTDLIRITGNEINNDLTAFRTENENLLRQRQKSALTLQKMSETDTTLTFPYALFDELQYINALNRELSLRAEEFITENPTQMSSLILINDFFTNNDHPETLERLLSYLEGDVTRTLLARQLQIFSERINSSAEGASVPYFDLISIDNDTINSLEFSGKYTLLSFVSTEGTGSRRMIESLKESYTTLYADSVRFISIYIDSDTLPVTHLESDSITWMVVAESRGWGSEIVDLFNIQYVPFNILICPAGIIRDRNILPQGVVAVIRPEEEEDCGC